jgi:hypothetical protein
LNDDEEVERIERVRAKAERLKPAVKLGPNGRGSRIGKGMWTD